MTARPGWVYLVGAGPGDPGLITRRGLELLRSCDAVFYDRLVATALVDEAADDAERVFVGKQAGHRLWPQAEIDAAVIAAARGGRAVVRLKGGDPYVLGRGADEAQALAAAGIPFEIVPGVSSAVAVPAYAGIPVTYGGVASSLAVLTAHDASEKDGRWSDLVGSADTLVVLMAVRTLADTVERMLEAGREPDEPAAVIERGTTPSQRTIVGPLGSIAASAIEAGITSPATLIVGQVVRLRDALNWFEQRPLFGRRVVLTRASTQTRAATEGFTAAGAAVIHLPLIEIAAPDSWKAADRAVRELSERAYRWVLFSSANSIDGLWERLEISGLDARAFGGTSVAAVGPATAAILSERGIAPDLAPEHGAAEAVVAELGRGPGRVLVPRVQDGPRTTIDLLTEQGWEVDEVAVYRNVPGNPDPSALEAVRNGEFDVLTFTSASAAENFLEIVGTASEIGVDPAGDAARTVACVGPKTAAAARAAGFKVDVVPDSYTTDALIDTLSAATPLSR